MPHIDTEKLEAYAGKIFDRLNLFNDFTLRTIGRRIKEIGKLSAHDQQALKNMADISGDMQAITKRLAEVTGKNIKDIERVYTQTVTDGVNTYRPLYDYRNMAFAPFTENAFAKQLVRNWAEQTSGEMINLSRTKALCFDTYNLAGDVVGSVPIEGAYQQVIDDAITAVSAGTVDFNTAMRESIKQLGGSGVRVNYGNGVTRSLSAAVRQNILYGAKQSAQAYDDYVGKQLGCDGFEVDAHAGCRPTHEFMQGQMYSYHGDKTVDGVTYADGAEALERLEDYNCLHFKTDVILGVSQPRYTAEELERIRRETTELIAYDGKEKTLYEWKQVQRRLERAVRKQGDIANMAKASGDSVLLRECNAKIEAYRVKYDALSKHVGLEPKLSRMAAYQGKTVESSAVKPKNRPEAQDIHYVGKIDKNIYKCVTEDIKTDEVIITDERIQHIKERHPNDYERFYSYIPEMISNPDYVIEANKANTAVILKEIKANDERFKLILRMAVQSDPKEYKNSVISFWKVGEATWKKALKNKKVLYRSE